MFDPLTEPSGPDNSFELVIDAAGMETTRKSGYPSSAPRRGDDAHRIAEWIGKL